MPAKSKAPKAAKASGAPAIPTVDFTRMITAKTRAAARQEAARAKARHVLASTDWAVLRQLETGQAVPAEVAQVRAEARQVLAEKKTPA
jgi:hypothetical protein